MIILRLLLSTVDTPPAHHSKLYFDVYPARTGSAEEAEKPKHENTTDTYRTERLITGLFNPE